MLKYEPKPGWSPAAWNKDLWWQVCVLHVCQHKMPEESDKSISNLLRMWSEGKSPNLTFNKLESSRNNGNNIHKSKNSGAKYANIWSDGVPSFFFFFFGFQILVFTADKLRPKLNTELELGVEQQVGSSPSTQKGYGFESSKKQYQVSGMIQASLEHEVNY